MLPSIFGESLFDDWMGFPFRGFESDVDRKLYGKHAAHVMKTDLKEHDEGYELKVDLPGFKKDQIDLQLQNGYLTITASKGLEEEGKDKKGKIVHQERYEGSMTRSFYIGENVKEEDVQAKFEDGVLTLDFPKEKPVLTRRPGWANSLRSSLSSRIRRPATSLRNSTLRRWAWTLTHSTALRS
jgi:HSP20 family molecular chaperone IbpA